MWVYIKNALFDWALCIIASSAWAYTACSGFYATQPYQTGWGLAIIIGACVAVVTALFLVSLNRMARIVGGIAIAAVILGLFAVAAATSPVENPMDDTVGNNLYLAFCVLLPPAATFLLSRTKPTCIVLIVVGTLFCTVIEYLYWYGHVISFVLLLASSVALYIYHTYQKSLLNSESDYLAFGSVTLAGIALAVIAIGAGVGIYALAIGPMEPPNLVVKLITEHYRAEEKEVRGVGSSADSKNDELTTETNDEVAQSSEKSESEIDDPNDSDAGNTPLGLLGLNNQNNPLAALGAGLASLTMNFPDWWPIIAALLLVALIAAAIGLKKLLRRRRFNKMLAQDDYAVARDLYLFFLARFERFKIPTPGSLTLQEYANNFADTFRKFEQRLDGPAFVDLTNVYARQIYGGQPVTKEELGQFTDYYRKFYKWASGYVGKLKYCRMFFRI